MTKVDPSVLKSLTCERNILRSTNAELLAALGYMLDTMLGEYPDENDKHGSSPRNPIWIRAAKEKARAAIAKAEPSSQ